MGKATIFFLVAYLFAVTLSLYGSLAGILNKGQILLEYAGSGVAFVLGVSTFYGICSKAHEVTHTVRYHTVVIPFVVHEYIMWITVLRQWKDASWLVWG
jgi:hypothetical protein